MTPRGDMGLFNRVKESLYKFGKGTVLETQHAPLRHTETAKGAKLHNLQLNAFLNA
jgi:hypothetical protein